MSTQVAYGTLQRIFSQLVSFEGQKTNRQRGHGRKKMGSCVSAITAPKKLILENVDGKETEYHEDFLEDTILGQGEFGIVKKVHPMNHSSKSMAVKILNKGMTFKDNTIFAPLSPESIRTEVEILRRLNGEHFNLKLFKLYETRTIIYIVTELCEGGHMMQWVSRLDEDLTIEQVSRVSSQMLDAVAHCARHGVIHRDIKPENVLFASSSANSSLRLIDFGSSSMDDEDFSLNPNLDHFTFAGSAFYSAPEMFQHKYNFRIDVWSVAVSIYVLVAGFPAESMQKAFNKIQDPKRDLTSLPNMPDSMPDSFFEMLKDMLVYKRKDRATAEKMLSCEFALLHENDEHSTNELSELDIECVLKDAESFNPKDIVEGGSTSKSRTKIVGSVSRHTSYLGYSKFERSVSTLLAAVLSSEEYNKLYNKITMELEGRHRLATEKTLKVIKVSALKEELENLGLDRPAIMMNKLPNASLYENFTFRISLLRLFLYNELDSSRSGMKLKQVQSSNLGHSSHGSRVTSGKVQVDLNRGRSVHGNNVWESWKKNKGDKIRMKDNLGSSLHM